MKDLSLAMSEIIILDRYQIQVNALEKTKKKYGCVCPWNSNKIVEELKKEKN